MKRLLRDSARSRALLRAARSVPALAGTGAGRSAAVVERRRRPSRRSSTSCTRPPTAGEPRLRAARGPHRDLRPGRHALGRASDLRQVCSRSTACPRWSPKHPEWKNAEPFKTVLSGDREAMAQVLRGGLEKIVVATHAGMTVEEFTAIVDEVARDGEAPALQAALHRAGLPADARGAELPARQRLPDLHRHRRRPGFRARLRRAGLRHPAGAGGRLRASTPSTRPRTASRC